jgi:ZIP family zinc transporter
VSAIGISVRNIPEGAVVGAGYLHQPKLGAFIALVIALHNIPEGIATGLPLCRSGICRADAFWRALLSGMVEPVGALVAALVLTTYGQLILAALAFAAGVMVFLTLDELVPAARAEGHEQFTAIGIVLGAVFLPSVRHPRGLIRRM